MHAPEQKSMMQIADYIDLMATQHPYQKAVIFPDSRTKDGRVAYTHLTYEQLYHETTRLALQLRGEGIDKGHRCALMVKPSLDFFILTFSLFKAGAIPIFIDPGIGRQYLKKCLEESQPTAFIGIPKAQIARILFGWCRRSLNHIITVDSKFGWGGLSLHKLKKKPLPLDRLRSTNPDDPAAILFTSGSTGQPKGAIYRHSNFMAQVELLKATYQIKPGERDLCTFPLFALFAPALGMTAIIPDMDFTRPADVDPEKISEAINNFGATNLFGTPALLRKLGGWLAANPRAFPSLKRVISAGAPVPAEVLEMIRPALSAGADIYTPYGATEALPVTSISASEILAETADKTTKGKGICVGKPVQGINIRVMRITDDPVATWTDSFAVETGVIGEIIVSGPHVSQVYYGQALANKLAKIADPKTKQTWHRMGDLGYVDAEGRLWFCGRKSQRIRTKQGDLYTVACEGVFNIHPSILRTALVGVGEPKQESPVLCVEVRNQIPVTDQAKIKQDLLALGRKHVATKGIESVLFHRKFPVDIRHNSKIFREKLKIWATKELKT